MQPYYSGSDLDATALHADITRITADGTRTGSSESLDYATTGYRDDGSVGKLDIYQTYAYNLEEAGHSITSISSSTTNHTNQHHTNQQTQLVYGDNPTRMTQLEKLQKIQGTAQYQGTAYVISSDYNSNIDVNANITLNADFINKTISGAITRSPDPHGGYIRYGNINLTETTIDTYNGLLEFKGNANTTESRHQYNNNNDEWLDIQYTGTYEGKIMGPDGKQVSGLTNLQAPMTMEHGGYRLDAAFTAEHK
ncbi:transferrin-binding protein-like solute binding protein [Testudinibacter sp. TR-2022]|uniref:factor H binding protein domain-containing protein n=1 Tax=Testudinibacter sp. TR-2022 TaxID=2585029 RepID=UPI001118F211|nr:factor H binding protein domain-containing protein [Testudinibacter sp. TR-2022]TNH02156.1 transferrin-binding protein-like solute binding protein [Pasteurellaceae bacterium Phil31]TNH10031.1 transferrin-binding protein-like solute binding protein [Testudinibacter sp. TR-2022]TNH11657.1 transferrin-binding protein-like solute binding protein [Testudinibacter sp. TR-2022]TNH12928.1 transferrin-binding protein-like solute binding protein [Testudinibacter sp. TR-2022]TNH14920.1 transferrin-bin